MSKVIDKVKADYVTPLTSDQIDHMVEGAVNGMLGSLDPYSSYLSPKHYQLMTTATKGEFGGIGLEVAFIGNMIHVISPIDDTPAQKAGLQPGDLITHVNGQDILTLSPMDILEKLHGKPGTEVVIRVRRGAADPFDVKLVRALITVNPVKYVLKKGIGYIRIAHFNEKTTDKLKGAIEALKKEAGKSFSGLILDLRNNPGGTLEQAVSVSSLFLKSGSPIVNVRGRDPQKNKDYKSTGSDLLDGLPIVILVNRGSASASEIVAGALSYHKRAVLVGSQTYGKGSVQVLMPLDNQGGLKLTTAKFYTPSGLAIEEKGLTPDIVVDLHKTSEEAKLIESKQSLIKDDDQIFQRALDLVQGLAKVHQKT